MSQLKRGDRSKGFFLFGLNKLGVKNYSMTHTALLFSFLSKYVHAVWYEK